MIIGITGNIGAGKDTFAQHLVVKGFIHISLSEFIREEVVKRGLEASRENLHNISNEMRKNFGADILARMAIKKIVKDKNYVITSLRNPAEIKLFKKSSNFFLIEIDAPVEVRFARVMARRRGDEKELPTLEQFKKFEAKETDSQSSLGQRLKECIKMAQFKIINNSDLKSNASKLEVLLTEIAIIKKNKIFFAIKNFFRYPIIIK